MEPSFAAAEVTNGVGPCTLRVGTAGWNIPKAVSDRFPGEGTHLQRYATTFRAAEINSSFYKPHRRVTYERWAESVPQDFRFSVKLPKSISHAASAEEQDALVHRFSEEVHGLGHRLGVVLVQFPPKRSFERAEMDRLFARLSATFSCAIACEPRHVSWFEALAERFLIDRQIARVAADPPLFSQASGPGGCSGLRYYRLHGSPIVYRSSYDDGRLEQIAKTLEAAAASGGQTWCIFDNTAASAAAINALALTDVLCKSVAPDE